MGKVKTVPISGVKLIIYPPMLFYLFSITCLVTYRMGLQLHPSKKKKKKQQCAKEQFPQFINLNVHRQQCHR